MRLSKIFKTKFLIALAMALATVAHSQTNPFNWVYPFQQNNQTAGFRWRAIKVTDAIIAPSLNAFPALPVTWRGDSTRGAMMYYTIDSSMYYFTGYNWIKYSSVNIGDSTNFGNVVLDSTNLPNYQLVFPINKKLYTSHKFLVDTVLGRLHIGWTVPPGGTHKLNVNGTSFLNGNVGIGTNAPTHTLSLGLGNTGIVSYNNAAGLDNGVTNWERVRQYWSGNTFNILSEALGSGAARNMVFTANSSSMLFGYDNTNAISFSRSGGQVTIMNVGGSLLLSTTTPANALSITSTVAQSGLGGYKAIYASIFENTLGAGPKLLIDLGTNTISGGPVGTHTPKFRVDNNGNVGSIGSGSFGSLTANSSAIGEFVSTTKGIFLANKTLVQRNAMTPVAGLYSYNTTYNTLDWGDGTYWLSTGVWFNSVNQSFASRGSGTGGTAVNRNFALGVGALLVNNGADNFAIGTNALGSNINGDNSVAIGTGAAQAYTGASSTTAIGFWALKANVTGSSCVAIGEYALEKNTVLGNTAVGRQALRQNVTGQNNTGVGGSALNNNLGSFNTAIGSSALFTNTTGNSNTAIGYNANGQSGLIGNKTGSNSVFIGTSSGWYSADGLDYVNDFSTNIGSASFIQATGTRNTAIGYYALGADSVANDNIGIGKFVLANAREAHRNIFVGDSLGYSTGNNRLRFKGDLNTFIGGGIRDTLSDRQMGFGLADGWTGISKGTGLNWQFSGISTNLPPINTTAAFEFLSVTGGIVPPRFLSAARPAAPQVGSMIFCSDCIANDGSTGVTQTYSSGSYRNHY